MACTQQTALNNLRTFNYSFPINSSINGRGIGNNIQFYSINNPNNPTYDEYKLRRKAEILQYNNIHSNNVSNTLSKKQKYSNIMKGNSHHKLRQNSTQTYFSTNSNTSNYNRVNNTLILTNSKNETCSKLDSLIKSSRNSNVPSYDFFYYNTEIPYHSSL